MFEDANDFDALLGQATQLLPGGATKPAPVDKPLIETIGSAEDFDSLLAPFRAPEPESAPAPSGAQPGAIRRGFSTGLVEQNPEMFAEAFEGLRHLTGRDEFQSASDYARSLARKLGPEYQPRVRSYRDIPGEGVVDTLDRAMTYLGEAFGQGVASTVPSLVTGGVGAGIGAVAGGAPGAVAGGVAGATISAAPQNYGELYKALKDEGVPPAQAARWAIVGAVPVTALDVASLERVIGAPLRELRAGGMKDLAKAIARAAGYGGVTEGVTEGAQTAIQEGVVSTATGKPFATRETFDQIVDSLIMGFTVGTPMAGTVRAATNPLLPQTGQVTPDTPFLPEGVDAATVDVEAASQPDTARGGAPSVPETEPAALRPGQGVTVDFGQGPMHAQVMEIFDLPEGPGVRLTLETGEDITRPLDALKIRPDPTPLAIAGPRGEAPAALPAPPEQAALPAPQAEAGEIVGPGYGFRAQQPVTPPGDPAAELRARAVLQRQGGYQDVGPAERAREDAETRPLRGLPRPEAIYGEGFVATPPVPREGPAQPASPAPTPAPRPEPQRKLKEKIAAKRAEKAKPLGVDEWRAEPWTDDQGHRWRVVRGEGGSRKDVWGHYETEEQARSAAAYARAQAAKAGQAVQDSREIAEGRLPVEDDRERQRRENIRKMDERGASDQEVKIGNVNVNDSRGGEMFGTKSLTVGGVTKAVADISIYGDEVAIMNIAVAPDARRGGLASRLVDDLFREFPDKTIMVFGGLTDDGAEFFRSRYDVADDGTITPKAQKQAESLFSGRMSTLHASSDPNLASFKPSSDVDPAARYDGGGGVFGPYTYLDETGAWQNGGNGLFGRDFTYNVEASFDKAFVLTPDNIDELRSVLGLSSDVHLTGTTISEGLIAKGYDGLVVRGFDKAVASKYASWEDVLSGKITEEQFTKATEAGLAAERELAEKYNISSDTFQDQVVSFRPEKSLRVVSGGKGAERRAAPQRVRPAASDIPRQDIGEDVAVTASGREVPVTYAIVDAAHLVPSQRDDLSPNPDYPQEMQPRDRTRAASALQIQQIANELNPRLLDQSPKASDGAPIIAPDGVVESGNGRVLAIRRAYAEGLPSAQRYRDYLAERGYPVEGMKAPVLVRVRSAEMSPEERAAFTREANERETLSMSATEQALADAAALPQSLLDQYRGGDVGDAANRPFVRGFLREVVGAADQARMLLPDGALSVEGRRRVEAALLAKAYGDPALISALVEDPDSNIRQIGGALTDAAAQWVAMRGDAAAGRINPAVDITRQLLEAVNVVRRARDERRNVAEFVGQDDIFAGGLDPLTVMFLRAFFRNERFTQPRGRDMIAEFLGYYAEQARKTRPEGGLFGAADVVGPREILEKASERQQGGQAGLFARRDENRGRGASPSRAGGQGSRDRARRASAAEAGRAEESLDRRDDMATSPEQRAAPREKRLGTLGEIIDQIGDRKVRRLAEKIIGVYARSRGLDPAGIDVVALDEAFGAPPGTQNRAAFITRALRRQVAGIDRAAIALREGDPSPETVRDIAHELVHAAIAGLGYDQAALARVWERSNPQHRIRRRIERLYPDADARTKGEEFLAELLAHEIVGRYDRRIALDADGKVIRDAQGRPTYEDSAIGAILRRIVQFIRDVYEEAVGKDTFRDFMRNVERLTGARQSWLLTGWVNDTAPGGREGVNPSPTYARPPSGIQADEGAGARENITESPENLKPKARREEEPAKGSEREAPQPDFSKAGETKPKPSRPPAPDYWPTMPPEDTTGKGWLGRRDDAPFYSALTRAVEGMKQTRAPGAQWLGMIRNAPGVKQDEIDWSGVAEWLQDRGSVTKDELLDFLRENEVKIEEVLHSAGVAQELSAASSRMEADRTLLRRRLADYGDLTIRMDVRGDGSGTQNVQVRNATPRIIELIQDGKIRPEDLPAPNDDLSLRQAAQAFVESSRRVAEIQEQVRAHDRGAESTRYDEYTLPGGENYRELLLTLPPRDAPVPVAEGSLWRINWPDGTHTYFETREEALEAARDPMVEGPGGTYRSSHWDEPNILVHVRFNERTDAEGKRVLFIEEIQSDWHQQGRRQGYATPVSKEVEAKAQSVIDEKLQPHVKYLQNMTERGKVSLKLINASDVAHWVQQDVITPADAAALYAYLDAFDKSRNSIPDAPFKTTWHELAVKRVLRWAAENGFDRVAWTPGEIQADRYDLQQHVSAIKVQREGASYTIFATRHGNRAQELLATRVPEAKLDDYLGKDLAKKIVEAQLGDGGEKTFAGLDLKVGGEGMKGFYDKILPAFVNRYVKKWGAKVGTTTIAKGDTSWQPIRSESGRWVLRHPRDGYQASTEFDSEAQARAFIFDDAVQVHSVDVTPAMRESVLGGQPLFRREDSALRKTYAKTSGWLLDALRARGRNLGDPLARLPNKDLYLIERGLTQGRIARINEMARETYEVLRQATPDEAKAVFAYLTTRGAALPAVRADLQKMAARTKRQIDAIGRALVQHGLISQEAYEKHRDAYLPRLYLKHVLEMDPAAIGAGMKTSKQGYTRARQDIPAEVRDVLLGEIKDPAFLSSTAIAVPLRDMAILDFLNRVAKNEDWVWKNDVANWRGQMVSAFWLKEQAAELRRMAQYSLDSGQMARMLKTAAEMDAIVAKSAASDADVPDGYKKLPDTKRYGALRGMRVRNEVYDDLVGAFRMIDPDAPIAKKIFEAGGVGTKATQMWKMGKVALNPPAQVRNFIGNMVLLHLSGVPIYRMPDLMVRAVREIRGNGKHWQVAKKYGLTAGTFSNNELFEINRELMDLRARTGGALPKLFNMGARIARFASDSYQMSEALFKTAKIIHEMGRGVDEAHAAIEANKWLFDYSLVPQTVKYLRNAPIGAPFLTFYYKSLPRVFEVALTKPWRFLPYVAMVYVLAERIKDEYDVSDEDLDALKLALPKWLREQNSTYLLPWKDDKGRWQAMNFGYFFPWSMPWEVASQIGKGDVTRAASAAGLLGGPVSDMLVALRTNMDPFTQKPIADRRDPPSVQLQNILTYLWRMGMPPWMTDIGFVKNVVDAASGTPKKSGETGLTVEQAALRAVGINIYPLEPERMRAENLRQMQNEITSIKARRTQMLKDQSLSPGEREKMASVFNEWIKQKSDALAAYARDSEIHPRLRTGQ